MEQVHCINFCDIMDYLQKGNDTLDCKIDRIKKKAEIETLERIYIGSYFCAQYFLKLEDELVEDLVNYAMKTGIKITLVVPIISQKNLEEAQKKLKGYCQYFDTCLDEITVNDYGMLVYIHQTFEVGLNMGRLFMKDYRDPRYPDYFKLPLEPKIFTNYLNHIIDKYQVDTMEFDPTHEVIDFSKKPKNIRIAIHTPFCYMTVGQICEYASINKEIEKKFRPNQPCAKECQETIIRYDLKDGREWVRIGRAIYFENNEYQIKGLNKYRVIYFPLEWEDLK